MDLEGVSSLITGLHDKFTVYGVIVLVRYAGVPGGEFGKIVLALIIALFMYIRVKTLSVASTPVSNRSRSPSLS